MSAQSESPAGYGFSGRLNWLIGGMVGGVVGSLLFGGFLWVVDPAIVAETIPAIYGFDPAQTVGWTFHMAHGVVLGIVYGFVVTREPVLGALTADVQTGFLANRGLAVRLIIAGLAYGLAVWLLLPVITTAVVISVSGVSDPGFPEVVFEALVGHLLYGCLLGALFSVFVDLTSEAESADTPLEEGA